jgi:hypothetical protein
LSYNLESRPIGIREAIGGFETGNCGSGFTSLDGIGIVLMSDRSIFSAGVWRTYTAPA